MTDDSCHKILIVTLNMTYFSKFNLQRKISNFIMPMLVGSNVLQCTTLTGSIYSILFLGFQFNAIYLMISDNNRLTDI